MKKIKKYILITLTLLLLLTSCSENAISTTRDTYTAYHRGVGYKVDTVNRTITQEGEENVFTYTIESMTVTITYPDNSTYWWTVNEMGGYGGWSDDYDAEKYIDGDVLIGILENVMPTIDEENEKNGGIGINRFFGLIFVILGVFYMIKPDKAWYVNQGWQFKDARPSDKALTYYRAGGGFIVVIGVIMMFL